MGSRRKSPEDGLENRVNCNTSSIELDEVPWNQPWYPLGRPPGTALEFLWFLRLEEVLFTTGKGVGRWKETFFLNRLWYLFVWNFTFHQAKTRPFPDQNNVMLVVLKNCPGIDAERTRFLCLPTSSSIKCTLESKLCFTGTISLLLSVSYFHSSIKSNFGLELSRISPGYYQDFHSSISFLKLILAW